MIPEAIQKQLTERETLRAEIGEKEKELAAMVKQERMLSQKIESAWQGHMQKVYDVFK